MREKCLPKNTTKSPNQVLNPDLSQLDSHWATESSTVSELLTGSYSFNGAFVQEGYDKFQLDRFCLVAHKDKGPVIQATPLLNPSRNTAALQVETLC